MLHLVVLREEEIAYVVCPFLILRVIHPLMQHILDGSDLSLSYTGVCLSDQVADVIFRQKLFSIIR